MISVFSDSESLNEIYSKFIEYFDYLQVVTKNQK